MTVWVVGVVGFLTGGGVAWLLNKADARRSESRQFADVDELSRYRRTS